MRWYCLTLLLLFFIQTPVLVHGQWAGTPITNNNVVDRNGQRTLTIDSSNTLHATWTGTNSLGNNVIYYSQKPCQSPWSSPESISDTILSAGPSALALDTNSQEVAMTWAWPATGSEIRVAVGNSGNWTQMQVTNSINNDLTPTVAVDGNGNLHLAWTSEDTGGTWKIHYAHNRFGAWQEQRIAVSNPGPFGGGASPKIALDLNGAPSITYREGNFNSYKIERLWLTHPDSTNWSKQFLNTPLGEEFVSDHVIDKSGTIHAVLSGNSGFGFPVDAYYMKKTLTGSWTTPVVIDLLQNAHVVNISVDDSGTPHVGLEGLSGNFYTGNIYYATEGSTGWTNQAINIYITSNYAFAANVVKDGQGNLHALANMDNSVSSSTAEIMHFKTGSCVTCAVFPDFMASDTSICEGETVVFTNSSAGGISRQWLVDGIPFDTATNTTRLFSTAGTQVISLIEDNGSCADTISQNIYISAYPTAGFNFPFEDSVLCQGGSITFTSTASGQQVQRWFDNGIQFSTSSTPSRTFIAPGIRTIMQVVYNGPCTDTSLVDIRVVANPFANFTFPLSDTAVCQGDTVNFTNNSTNGSLHEWYENGSLFASTFDASQVFTSAGTRTIMLIEREGDCTDTAMATVQVNAPPTADFSFTTTLLQADFTDQSTSSPVSWLWDFGDGNTDTQQNPTHTYSQDGSYFVCLEVTDANGCAGTFCDTVTVLGTGFQNPFSSGIKVFPNPSNGRFLIELSNTQGNVSAQLYSVEGKMVDEFVLSFGPTQRAELNLSGISAGSYLLTLTTQKGLYREKIVIMGR